MEKVQHVKPLPSGWSENITSASFLIKSSRLMVFDYMEEEANVVVVVIVVVVVVVVVLVVVVEVVVVMTAAPTN